MSASGPLARHLPAVCAALLASTYGCGDPASPTLAVVGAYSMQRLGDAALPAVVDGTAGAGFNVVRAERLELDAGGAARLTSERGHSPGSGPGGFGGGAAYDYTVRGEGTWARTGDSVVVRYAYTGDQPWSPSTGAATLTLRAADGGAELRGTVAGDTRVRVYRR